MPSLVAQNIITEPLTEKGAPFVRGVMGLHPHPCTAGAAGRDIPDSHCCTLKFNSFPWASSSQLSCVTG
jgi:hypothetical protein